jgi:hypothetical protein
MPCVRIRLRFRGMSCVLLRGPNVFQHDANDEEYGIYAEYCKIS